MITGLVSSRYAKALLDYSSEQGEEKKVMEDVMSMSDALNNHRGLEECITGCCSSMRNFLMLVVRNRRVDNLPMIFRTFIKLYNSKHGITKAVLTTAAPVPGLKERLLEMLKELGLNKVDVEEIDNPAILGGFIFQVDDKRINASLASELEKIKKELLEKNKRII